MPIDIGLMLILIMLGAALGALIALIGRTGAMSRDLEELRADVAYIRACINRPLERVILRSQFVRSPNDTTRKFGGT